MTIGIAAAGPGAPAAILDALRAVEAIGQGALGGFVSLAAISQGQIMRAAVQDGGTKGLLSEGAPPWLQTADCAVLMSSGPHRPEPLAQFTPGDPSLGLVTGHRFPNSEDRNGQPLNLAVLDLMRRDQSAQAAVDRVIADNMQADAGLLAISPDGAMGIGDSSYLDQFADRGRAVLSDQHGCVGVVHNSITPYRGLALIAAERALERLRPPTRDVFRIEVKVGIALRAGPSNSVTISANGEVTGLTVLNPTLLLGTKSFGLGYRADVIAPDQTYRLNYEPYMVAKNGILISVDGADAIWLACSAAEPRNFGKVP